MLTIFKSVSDDSFFNNADVTSRYTDLHLQQRFPPWISLVNPIHGVFRSKPESITECRWVHGRRQASELHKRRLSLPNSVITSDNECLKGLVQRQLACSFNVKSSFFITSKILEKYELPSLSQLLCSSYSKLQWKHTYVKAVNKFWSK